MYMDSDPLFSPSRQGLKYQTTPVRTRIRSQTQAQNCDSALWEGIKVGREGKKEGEKNKYNFETRERE